MNRDKKNSTKNGEQLEKDLTSSQRAALELEEVTNRAVEALAKKLHVHQFPEEYDFMYDDHVDVAERRKGRNPMSSEYVARVNERRRSLGVRPLSDDGTAATDEAMALCRRQVREVIESMRTRVDEVMFYKWDPLHLSNSTWARDEYESYVPQAFKLALESTSYQPLADYLTHVATETMRMTEDRDHDVEIAQLIFALVNEEAHFPDQTVVEVD